MSIEYVKFTFALPRADACALACIAEQSQVTVPLAVRKIVQAEIRRRECELVDGKRAQEFVASAGAQSEK